MSIFCTVKKKKFDDYLLCMEQDAPLDEIAIVIITHMFHFHICILTETKFWEANREHEFGMCFLLLGLTGNMQFIPLHHCTTETGITSEKENQPEPNDINVKGSACNLHNTCSNSSTCLTEKLSGVLDPNKFLN